MKKKKTAAFLGGTLAAALIAGNAVNPAYAETVKYYDGSYTESGHVEFHGDVSYDLYVTVNVKDGVISDVFLNEDKNADIESVNMPYANYAMNGMAASYAGTNGEAVDAVSGATYSSKAISEAVSKAMEKSAANQPDEEGASKPTQDNNQNKEDEKNSETENTDNGDKAFEDVLKSGSYELTAESYAESAPMKMPAYICIDAENNKFIVHPYKNGVVDYSSDKGSGSITFDSTTGVYTMTYEAGVTVVSIGSTTTFTADNGSITFTSPLRYGAAQMNTVDEEGNFLAYTAKLYKADTETPSNPKEDETEQNPSSESTEEKTETDDESEAVEADKTIQAEENNAQQTGTDTVKTADKTMTGIYIFAAMLSGVILFAAAGKKRKDTV